ncbi:hypothetical protein ACIPY1_17595 [Paenarthrobacter nicotinovorans]|uniref:hypothetical protein n=1 Tax=Paenarthrobacter nicotinovorans TaxID=29320 RepID=UPI00382A87B9
MRQTINQALDLPINSVTYQPTAGTDRGTLMITLQADRQADSWDLWNDVAERLDGDPYAAMLMIDKAASRRLQEHTATIAVLANDAKEVHLYLPVPLTADTHTGTAELAPHQAQLLPAFRDSIREVLPPELHAQTDALVAYAASQVPGQDDVTAAFERTTVADAVREFDNNQETPTLRAEPTAAATTRLLPNTQNSLPKEAVTPEAGDASLSVAKAYYVEPTVSEPGQVVAEFNVPTKPTPDKHLIEDATRILVDAGTDHVAGIIESLATDHLRNATGTTARIHDDGTIISIRAQLPVDNNIFPADTALNSAQTQALPGIEQAVRNALPAQAQEHATALAVNIAKELPERAQVTDAYNQPTLSEVMDHHQRRYGPPLVQPLATPLPAALQTYQRSFPAHPSAALTGTTETATASTTSTTRTPHQQLGHER